MQSAGSNSKILVPGVALAVIGLVVAGCAALPYTDEQTVMTPALLQQLQAQGTTPGSVSLDMLRPDGLMKNGLLPEQWGDTN